MGPESTPSSTRCTVQPVIVTPEESTSRWAWAPGKSGSNAGCTLMILPFHLPTNDGVRILMYPLRTTNSASTDWSVPSTISSCARRRSEMGSSDGTGMPFASIPSFLPCSRPPASWLSARTRTVRWLRGSFSWNLRREARPEPPPEISTANLRGSSIEPIRGSTKGAPMTVWQGVLA